MPEPPHNSNLNHLPPITTAVCLSTVAAPLATWTRRITGRAAYCGFILLDQPLLAFDITRKREEARRAATTSKSALVAPYRPGPVTTRSAKTESLITKREWSVFPRGDGDADEEEKHGRETRTIMARSRRRAPATPPPVLLPVHLFSPSPPRLLSAVPHFPLGSFRLTESAYPPAANSATPR
ncbi:hypothetical protein CVT26_008405 [Gymnopilus dilepis]|uniref:Uncharacterized protein n=1 Tax=Gymnopilus dilepis TaxID=231916 RepID=A0A409WNV2_9AGAR|nr:hypothetical protein CVT26_008405 [Gymnopilus dilepis]